MNDDEAKASQIWQTVSYFISIVGSFLSVLSYIIIILSVSLFKSLRNVPGLCILILSLYLLLADSLFLLQVTVAWYVEALSAAWCKLIGISMHYCLILAHIWSVLIALDVSCKFSSRARTFWQGMQKAQLYKNIAIAFSVASLLEITLLVLESLDVLHAGFESTKHGVCFIHGFNARLLFYVVPAVLSSLFSFGAFLYIICNISETRRKSSMVLGSRKQKNRNNILLIALKLALIFGSTELVGFIQVPNAVDYGWQVFNTAVYIIYSILRSLRGVLLAAVHVCRKEVFLLYKECIYSISPVSG